MGSATTHRLRRLAPRRGGARPRPRLRLPRVPPRVVLAALALAAVLAAGYFWLRDSSFVRVRDVYVVGLRSEQQDEIRSALQREAVGMSTLNVQRDVLESIVARYPSVARIDIRPDFPHKLTIEIVERVPVAALDVGGRRLAVTAGGVVLPDIGVQRSLPLIPTHNAPSGRRVEDPANRAAIAVLAAAPPQLRSRIVRTRLTRSRGFVLDLRNGPDIVIGAARELEAKWMAAARVLADVEAQGASAIDVRVPERPAAAGVAPEPTPTPTPAPGTQQPAPAGTPPAPTPTPAPTVAPTTTPGAVATPTPTVAAP